MPVVEDAVARLRQLGIAPEAIEEAIERGTAIIGTPDDAIAAIERLDELSGGYGGLMVMANEFTSREKTLKSYELLARYVMPRFQGSLVGLEDSQRRCEAQSRELRQAADHAIEQAHRAYEARTAPSPPGLAGSEV